MTQRAILVQLTPEQIDLLSHCSVEELACLGGLFSRLQAMQGPIDEDAIQVPGSIDLQSLIADIRQMTETEREALAQDDRPPALRGFAADDDTVDANYYERQLGDADDLPAPGKSVPRYRSRRVEQADANTRRAHSIAEQIAKLKQVVLPQED